MLSSPWYSTCISHRETLRTCSTAATGWPTRSCGPSTAFHARFGVTKTSARVHLSVSGTLLETLADPKFQHDAYGIVDCGSLLWHLQNNAIDTDPWHRVLSSRTAAHPGPRLGRAVRRWLGIARHLFNRTEFRGFWPPEMGFCMELIPALRRAGYRYVIVDSEHVEAVTPMRWEELRYRPHWARFGGEEIIVVVRDRELSDAQEAGLDAGWFIQEVCARTQFLQFSAARHDGSPMATTAAGSGTRRRRTTFGATSTTISSSECARTKVPESAPRLSTTTSMPMEPKARCRFAPAPGTPVGTAEPASSNGRDHGPQREALERVARNEPSCPCCFRAPPSAARAPTHASTPSWKKLAGESCEPKPVAISSGETPGCNAATTISTPLVGCWAKPASRSRYLSDSLDRRRREASVKPTLAGASERNEGCHVRRNGCFGVCAGGASGRIGRSHSRPQPRVGVARATPSTSSFPNTTACATTESRGSRSHSMTSGSLGTTDRSVARFGLARPLAGVVFLSTRIRRTISFNRGQFYGFADDVTRFAFFSKAALEFMLRTNRRPDVIHCHDWQTALLPVCFSRCINRSECRPASLLHDP